MAVRKCSKATATYLIAFFWRQRGVTILKYERVASLKYCLSLNAISKCYIMYSVKHPHFTDWVLHQRVAINKQLVETILCTWTNKHHLEGLNHSQWVPCTFSWVPGGAPSAGWPSACTGPVPADRYPAPWTEWAGPPSYSPASACTPGTTTNGARERQSREQWYCEMHYCGYS